MRHSQPSEIGTTMNFESVTIGGQLSGLYAEGSKALLVLAHGAGAGHDHQHMNRIAQALAAVGVGTLRYNFPFIEQGRRRVDKLEVCLEVIGDAANKGISLSGGLPVFVGGHSFGGRMSTHFAVNSLIDIKGIICFSFPLHIAKKPAVTRAMHLPDIELPLLLLSGTRDDLADRGLMKEVVAPLKNTRLCWLETADHSFKILKRTRKNPEDVYDEAARLTSEWIDQL